MRSDILLFLAIASACISIGMLAFGNLNGIIMIVPTMAFTFLSNHFLFTDHRSKR